MTLELAKSCTSYVTCVVNGADVVPQFSQGALDDLRESIGTSHLFDELCGVQPQAFPGSPRPAAGSPGGPQGPD